MGRGALAGFTHALHIDQIAELTKLGDELADMDASTAIDMGWIFAGQDGYAHAGSLAHLFPARVRHRQFRGQSGTGQSLAGIDFAV